MRANLAWLLIPLLTGCVAPSHLTERNAWTYLEKARDSGSNYTPVHRDALVRLCVEDYLAWVRKQRSPHTPARAIESEAWVYRDAGDTAPLRIALPGVGSTRPLLVKGVYFRRTGGRLVCVLGGTGTFAPGGHVYLLDGDTDSPVILSRWVFFLCDSG